MAASNSVIFPHSAVIGAFSNRTRESEERLARIEAWFTEKKMPFGIRFKTENQEEFIRYLSQERGYTPSKGRAMERALTAADLDPSPFEADQFLVELVQDKDSYLVYTRNTSRFFGAPEVKWGLFEPLVR